MFEILPFSEKNVLAVKASGKLTDADYQEFLPMLESLIRERGPVSVYLELEDFHGWEPKAAWDDLRFGLAHDRDFRRIAVVGDMAWEHAAIAFANLFTHTPMRFFDTQQTQAAREWLEEKPQPEQPIQRYRNLLLATDFSAHSERAARRAAELVELYSARLDVVHIVEEMAYYTNWYDPGAADVPVRDEAQEKRVEQRLQEFAEQTGLGNDAVLTVEWGHPKWSIVSCAREKNADLIIMGARGTHGIGRVLGSVSTGVFNHAPCDVLIVHS